MSRRTVMMLLGGLLVTVLAHLAIATFDGDSASAKRAGPVDTAIDPTAQCGGETQPIEDQSAQNTDNGDDLSPEERNDPLRIRA
jgi:hypothetical protein